MNVHMDVTMKAHSFSSEDIKKEILKLVQSTKVVTTSEIAKKTSVSWNTAEHYLLELTLEGSLIRMKKAGVNLWVIK